MKRLTLGILLTACVALAQEPASPAAYQPIRIKFRVVDLDGRPLEGASVAARLDPESTRLPPDHVLKAKSGADEFTYTLSEQMFPVFSTQQHVGPEGFCEVPFIVYSNRQDQPIDYEMLVLYKEPNRNVLFSADTHRSVTNTDDGKGFTLHTNVRKQVELSSLIVALIAWFGVTVMGFLLFFRGMYPRWLANGKSIDLSRALCWSGTLLICLFALGLIYWWLLPRIFGLWIFFALLFVIWLAHLAVSVSARRRTA
jgi:hypothetical protein